MIKQIITIFLTIILSLSKKIFIRENRTPHKIMDNLANKLHSIFIFTSFPILYISFFEIKINSVSINAFLYIVLFLQFVIVVRYFNPMMLKKKDFQANLINKIKKISLLVFIANWIFVSFLFSLSFLLIFIINNVFYVFILKQIHKQKEHEEFKKQFGTGNYSKKDIVQKHVLNLFELKLDEKELTRSQIKKQYRLMAKKYHPDVYKGHEKDKFTSINMSYNFLLDLVKS